MGGGTVAGALEKPDHSCVVPHSTGLGMLKGPRRFCTQVWEYVSKSTYYLNTSTGSFVKYIAMCKTLLVCYYNGKVLGAFPNCIFQKQSACFCRFFLLSNHGVFFLCVNATSSRKKHHL